MAYHDHHQQSSQAKSIFVELVNNVCSYCEFYLYSQLENSEKEHPYLHKNLIFLQMLHSSDL